MSDHYIIDFEESIRKGWLSYSYDPESKMKRIFNSWDTSLIIAVLCYYLYKLNQLATNANENAVAFLAAVMVLLLLYRFLRRITERKLHRIETGNTMDENKTILREYAARYNYEVVPG